MESLGPLEAREAEFAKYASSEQDLAALNEHVEQVISGSAFKGSHRSGQFLKYIVDQSLAGHFESLKERMIGVELFGRSHSYDTGEDAIVRVTASDVRRRLMQHYSTNEKSSAFRLSLPLGSYIPEIKRNPVRRAEGNTESHPADPKLKRVEIQPQAQVGVSPEIPVRSIEIRPQGQTIQTWLSRRKWLLVCIAMAIITGWSFLWSRSAGDRAMLPTHNAPIPWSSLLASSRPVHVITSDPNIVVVQEITGRELSLSDYANHRYISDESGLTPEELRYCRSILWGDNSAAAVDPPIALRIGAFAAMKARTADARASRSIQFSDLKTDDNFIFLGSPRSDPWTSLFNDQLDFKFAYDPAAKQEIIINSHPHAQESAKYVPTAQGWATGQSFAIVAFVQNPDTNGQVLILAGADGEGTEAAGKFVTDLPRLSSALYQCGIKPAGAPVHFEFLLRLDTMAGSPSHVDVVSCHILGSGVSH